MHVWGQGKHWNFHKVCTSSLEEGKSYLDRINPIWIVFTGGK